jgi:hypothetical protein
LTPSTSILLALARHNVDFLVVGGYAAVVLGAPIMTWDLDVVHSTVPENLPRVLRALEELDACYRYRPDLRPNESHLAGKGHQLLKTRFGSFDVLGAIGKGRTYEDLLPHCQWVEILNNLKIRVLDLETQIAIKEEIGGEKDLAVLPVLRRTLAEIRRTTKP